MGAIKTISRRAFLIGSTAVAGGVAFGTYAFRKEIPNPLLNGLNDGEVAITPYVKPTRPGLLQRGFIRRRHPVPSSRYGLDG